MSQEPSVLIKPLNLGDTLPTIVLKNSRGRRFSFQSVYGHPSVIIYNLNNDSPECEHTMTCFQEHVESFKALGYGLIMVSPNDWEDQDKLVKAHQLTFPLLADPRLLAARELGAAQWTKIGPKEAVQVTRSTLIVDGQLRVRKKYAPQDISMHVQEVLNDIKTVLPEWQSSVQTMLHPPVLQIPSVLEPGLCQEIIQNGHINAQLSSYIDKRLYTKVAPELKRAFRFDATRREPVLIVHEKNIKENLYNQFVANATEQTKHRCFELSINLNSERVEGGGLCFPEYARSIYKPKSGDGLVFSCHLLQERAPIEKGEAIRLMTYFYNEQMAQKREAVEKEQGGDYRIGSTFKPDDPVF